MILELYDPPSTELTRAALLVDATSSSAFNNMTAGEMSELN